MAIPDRAQVVVPDTQGNSLPGSNVESVAQVVSVAALLRAWEIGKDFQKYCQRRFK